MIKKEFDMSQHKTVEYSRRTFLERAGGIIAGLSALNVSALALAGCRGEKSQLAAARTTAAGGPLGEPENISWQTVITSKDEPGRPLVVTGQIFRTDGKTPVEGVTLYVYHTDNRGIYTDGRDVTSTIGADPPARLRGWMKTDREGRYEYRTIKPASYPNTNNPEHVHAKAYGAGYAERWIESFNFDDDPLITRDVRSRFAGLGRFSPVMTVTGGGDGILRCVRDIRLELKGA
jgi:protocatechuate 3,4-dioxygenase beta subunit